MRSQRSATVLALFTALSGCAESTIIRSYPPGAKLYVNGQFEGLTPVKLTIPRSQFSAGQIGFRLEHDGYAATDGTLRTQICGGRVAGGVFTLGIVLIFRRPTCFSSPQDFALAPLPGQAASASGPAGVHQPTVDERLERIKRMRDQGTITNEEYEHYRQEILKDL